MDLVAAIETLRELVGQSASVARAGVQSDRENPFRVAQIDFLASRENRCILGRTLSDGTYESLRRPVTDITGDRRFFEADAAVADARVEDIRAALGHSARIPR